MERLSNRVSTVIELLKPINLRTPEAGDNTVSEMSVQNSAAWFKVLEDIFNRKLCSSK
jgi:hypothetical protein